MSTENILDYNVENFIPNYPTIFSPNLEYDLFSRWEFYGMKLGIEEIVPEKGSGIPLQHQEIMARYYSPFTPYTDGLIFHAVGTGKTCEASLIVERFKLLSKQAEKRKPAIILVRNDNQVQLFREQISKVCTSNVYFAKKKDQDEVLTRKQVNLRLKEAISKTYDIQKVEGFLKIISRKSDEQIRKDYSFRDIFIDEAHHYRETNNLYSPLYRFLHIVEGSRKFLLTGTPIKDKVWEIASLMNLILPIDENLPTGKDFVKSFVNKGEINKEGKNALYSAFKGRVSFLRPMMTTAKRNVIGMTQPWLENTVIFPSVMSPLHERIADEAKKSATSTKSKSKGGAFLINAKNASTMILPILDSNKKVVSYSGRMDAYNKAVSLRQKKVGDAIVKYYVMNQDVLKFITEEDGKPSLQKLAVYSPKFASIINLAFANPDQIIFIYNENVTGTGGCIVLGLILEKFGFVWAKTSRAISKPGTRKRFGIMSSVEGTLRTSAEISSFLNIVNSSENIGATKCQIIIGSEKVGEAITIKNVNQAHNVNVPWNFSLTDQALGRVYRAGTHILLPPEQRFINIYQHVVVAAATEGEEGIIIHGQQDDPDTWQGYLPTSISGVKASSKETVDIYIYKIVEKKDKVNSQVYRILKKASWDCALFYDRNVLETDLDGSRDCNYKKCNYHCMGIKDKFIDKNHNVWIYSVPKEDIKRSTFNLLYSDYIEDQCSKLLQRLFKRGTVYSFDYVWEYCLKHIPDVSKFSLLTVIRNMIESKFKFSSPYGFVTYLREDRDVLYLDMETTSPPDYFTSKYVSLPIVTDRLSFVDIVDIMDMRSKEKEVIKFCKNPTAEGAKQFNPNILAILVEKTFENKDKKRALPLIDVLKPYYYEMKDGTIIHTLYSNVQTDVSYKRSEKATGLTRKYNPSFNSWFFVSDNKEETDYINELKSERMAKIASLFEKYKVYGSLTDEGEFLIHTAAGITSVKPGKGRTCASYNMTHISKISAALNFEPFVPTKSIKALDKKTLLKKISVLKSKIEKNTKGGDILPKGITNNAPLSLLQRIYAFLKMLSLGDSTNTRLCSTLRGWLEENGAMVEKF